MVNGWFRKGMPKCHYPEPRKVQLDITLFQCLEISQGPAHQVCYGNLFSYLCYVRELFRVFLCIEWHMDAHKLQNISRSLRSCGMLRRQNWKLVSRNHLALIFKGQAVIDCPKMSVTKTNICWVTPQNSENLIYTATEVWNRAKYSHISTLLWPKMTTS
jgi:hypothetical protein